MSRLATLTGVLLLLVAVPSSCARQQSRAVSGGDRASPAAASSVPVAEASATAPQPEDLGPKDNAAQNGEHPLEALIGSLTSKPRPELLGKHPRVLVTTSELVKLRKRAKTSHRAVWAPVLQKLRALKAPPPAAPAQERRAQNEVGLAIAEAALAYQVERDVKYLAAAKRYMDAAVSYDVWGYTYNKPNLDLAAGHLLYGLGLGYDLLYEELTPIERERYRNKLVKQARLLYEYYVPKPGRTYAYSQNHVFIPISGLGIAAYALYGDVPEAAQWAQLSRAILSRVLDTYSEDGYYYEAFEYWVFSTPWIMAWLQAHQHVTGEDLFDRPGLRNMHLYLAHAVLPDGKNVFDFGDTFLGTKTRLGQGEDYARTHPGGHLHSNYSLLYGLARRFRSPEIQGVAERARQSGQVTAFGFLSLIDYDPQLAAASSESLPPYHYFPDHEVLYYRSDWTGAATALAFKCGPPEGHAALPKMQRFPDWHSEAGHSHPDANGFILYGKGEYLSGDSGYAGVPMSDQQNTLLVNGKGQAREGQGHNAFLNVPYERLNQLKLEVATMGAGELRVIGHAAAAYEPELGVEHYDRELRWVSPTELELVDRVTTTSPADLTELFHSDTGVTKRNDAEFLLGQGKAALRITLPSGAGWQSLVEPNWLTGPGMPGSVAKGERESRGMRLRLTSDKRVKSAEFSARLQIVQR